MKWNKINESVDIASNEDVKDVIEFLLSSALKTTDNLHTTQGQREKAARYLKAAGYLMRKYPVGKITGWTEEDCFYHAQELIDNIQK